MWNFLFYIGDRVEECKIVFFLIKRFSTMLNMRGSDDILFNAMDFACLWSGCPPQHPSIID